MQKKSPSLQVILNRKKRYDATDTQRDREKNFELDLDDIEKFWDFYIYLGP